VRQKHRLLGAIACLAFPSLVFSCADALALKSVERINFGVHAGFPTTFEEVQGMPSLRRPGFQVSVQIDTLGIITPVDVTGSLKDGILRNLFNNAVGNAWMDNYHSSDAFTRQVRNEIAKMVDQAQVLAEFSAELDEILSTETYFGVLYALDEIEKKKADDPYRNADFSFQLMQIQGDRDPQKIQLLLVRAGGWHFYYVFTKDPIRVFQKNFQEKRWGYLHEVDHEKIGYRFTKVGSDYPLIRVEKQGDHYVGYDNLGGTLSLHRSEQNPAFSPRNMEAKLKLRNSLLRNPE
jgi:hypothetical protein